APSGLDMLSVGGNQELLKRYSDRPQAVIDELRIEVRTAVEELEKMAAIMADRLNASQAPCAVLNPLKGWSSLDEKGRDLYDPVADSAFMEKLKSLLNINISVIDVDLHLNTPEFGEEAVNLFHQLYDNWEKT
ncbi:MAG: Tm-1-like ATP-binding domain-containing protein, partial [Candidatus Marinimicrobia bacterium]|nr:Tm-1-like ATP-binding domain-containing protein [Candidatus Neomarinimicrobiota bacterium]